MIAVEGMDLVEEKLDRILVSDVDLLRQASEHIIRAGGKRLRPRVVLLSYKAVGGNDIKRVVPLAVAVELIHTAALIHDDINDRSDTRRGRPTVNAMWGDSLALLTGDFIFTKLFSLIATYHSKIIQALADSCVAIVEGETLQMMGLGDMSMTEEVYLKIVGKKTASLFSACAGLGGIMAGGTERQITALRCYGFNLGMAFQIRDDLLDLVGKKDELGKPVATDMDQGKMSLATIFALKRSERAREIISSKDTAKVIPLLRDTGSIEYSMARARGYSEEAKEALSVLPGSEARTLLFRLADLVINRDR